MSQILSSAPAGLASGHFWQIGPNQAPAKFLAGFPDWTHFSTTAVNTDYLQLKVMKLVLASNHMRDLTVQRTLNCSALNKHRNITGLQSVCSFTISS